MMAAGQSPAGSEWATLPPIVPLFLTCTSPMCEAQSGSNGQIFLQQRRRLELIMSGHGADGNLVAVLANVRQVLDATDIDEQCRLRQPQLHRRDKTVTAGEYLRVIWIRASSVTLRRGSGAW